MIEILSFAMQLAGVVLVAAVLSSVLSGVLYLPFRQSIRLFDPSTRSLATLCFALIAPAASIVTALLYLVPGHAQLLVVQHCHGGDCSIHAPLVAARSPGGIGLFTVASFLILGLVAGIARVVIVGRRRLAVLFVLGVQNRIPDHLILESDRLFAWCCGLLRQRIVISRGLLDRLSPPQLDVVLAHEAAHAARFDNLRSLAAQWSTRLWPSNFRDRILADLVADCEQSCDSAALCVAADPALFRQAVDVMTQEPSVHRGSGVVQFGSQVSAYRISAASAGTERRPSIAYLTVAFMWILQSAVAIAASHPIVETVAAIGFW
ncbi:MAG: M48 family metalloprotease [Pseudomonadales bacterium]